MINTRIINNFNSDISNIVNIKAQHQQIVATITNRCLKSEPTFKKKQQQWQTVHSLLSLLLFFTVILHLN